MKRSQTASGSKRAGASAQLPCPPDAGTPRVSGGARGHLMCMHVTIIGASQTIGSNVVQGLRVEDAYGLACLARRRSEDPDSRGVDQRSVDFSTVACHDTLVGASTGAGAVVHSARTFPLPDGPACLPELGTGGIRRVLMAVTETGVPHRGAPPARGGSLRSHRRYARERGRRRGRTRSQAGARALCGGPRHAGCLACAPAAARHRVAGHGLRDGPDAPTGVAGGMREAASGEAPVLQPRTGLGDATHRGPVAVRRLP